MNAQQPTAFERILDALRDNGATIRETRPGQAQAQCPAHDDTAPSLSVTGIEGQALVHCHAGCQAVDVLAALGLAMRDLYDTRRGADYRYDNGRTVHRKLDKQFPQSNTDRPAELYRLSKVREAVAAGQPVYVVEGEKDVHALESVGAVATCSPMGAGKWGEVDPSPLHGATARVIADQDNAGRKHAADVAASLAGKCERLELLAPKDGNDAADHIAAGYGLDEFLPVLDGGDGTADPSTSTWAPTDLAPYLDGSHRPAAATIMPRTDGVCLLYPGLVHSFHGETESGKSLIMQIEAARLLAAGERVLFIDFESDPGSVIQRLLEWGAPPDAIRDLLDYVHPEVDPRRGAEIDRAQFEALLRNKYALAVIDGVTDALGVFSYATKENDDVSSWMRVLPKRIAAETGAAVALIDHVTKDSDSRGRFAIGAQAKLAGLTGAAYTVEVDQHLGRGLYGVVVLRIGKDRPGTIRAQCGEYHTTDRTQEAARVIIDSRNPDAPAATIEPPKAVTDADGVRLPFRATTLMEKVSRVVETDPGVSKNEIAARVGGTKSHVLAAVDRLVAERFLSVEHTSNNTQRHTSVKPYRQESDPTSDRYIEDRTTEPPKPVVPVVVRGSGTYPGTPEPPLKWFPEPLPNHSEPPEPLGGKPAEQTGPPCGHDPGFWNGDVCGACALDRRLTARKRATS